MDSPKANLLEMNGPNILGVPFEGKELEVEEVLQARRGCGWEEKGSGTWTGIGLGNFFGDRGYEVMRMFNRIVGRWYLCIILFETLLRTPGEQRYYTSSGKAHLGSHVFLNLKKYVFNA